MPPHAIMSAPYHLMLCLLELPVFEQPYLSIVLPAHNEAPRLPRALQQIDAFLSTQDYSAEVVIVENGSSDDTFAIAQQFAATHDYVRAFQETARGKGGRMCSGTVDRSAKPTRAAPSAFRSSSILSASSLTMLTPFFWIPASCRGLLCASTHVANVNPKYRRDGYS